MSVSFVYVLLILAYSSVILIIPYIMLDETHIISIISDQLDRVFGLFTIILAFMARKRIHNLLSSTKGSVT